jgi:hypothetical protein
MRIAWFRDTPLEGATPFDDTAALIAELRGSHVIDVNVEADAHDFVWRHALSPWDLCVYELGDSRQHQFLWAYLLNYPGIVVLKSVDVTVSWGGALSREGRLDDYLASFRFDHRSTRPPVLQVPMYASRMVVTPYAALAAELQDTYPGARIRCAPFGATAVESVEPEVQPIRRPHALRIAVTSDRLAPLERAAARARAAGADIELITAEPPARLLRECDVVVDVAWPPFEKTQTPALAAMAAGKTLVTLESDATADWPTIDPQTWLPRDAVGSRAPIAVTVDPRDEEHSLMQIFRRLVADVELRDRIGQAAKAWWQQHATPAQAAAAWLPILDEAVRLTPPSRPAHWPAHLDADGTELARAILDEFGVTSELLPTRNPAQS